MQLRSPRAPLSMHHLGAIKGVGGKSGPARVGPVRHRMGIGGWEAPLRAVASIGRPVGCSRPRAE
eukprot:14795618-Alexandrium_andersonii.AAC.1